MKDNKPWYEKVSIWITIIVGICGIFGISVFGNISLLNNNKNNPETINDDNDDKTDNNRLSKEELLIKQNLDLIQQLKSEYFDQQDIKISLGNRVTLRFYENAGYIYSDLEGTELCCKLVGEKIIPSNVIVLDYISDKIIYTFTPENGNYIHYAPGNQKEFYCVVFCDNYDIYVTPPMYSASNADIFKPVDICLNKTDSKYSPLFQVRPYKRDLKLNEWFQPCSSDYVVEFKCKKTSSDYDDRYFAVILDSGVLSFYNGTYFSLNTNYVIDFFLYNRDDLNKQLSNNTFDRSVSNTNYAEIYFLINNENDIEN